MTPSVYLMKDNTGLIKVGASRWGMSRVRNCYSPTTGFRIGVLCTQPHKSAYKIEARAHKLLSGKRRKGEWFDCGIDEALAAVMLAWHELVGRPLEFRMACKRCQGFGVVKESRCTRCDDGLEAQAKVVHLARRRK